VGSSAGLDRCGKSPLPWDSIPGPPFNTEMMMADTCECGNELSGSIKYGEFLD
jgi:hypothetical protein